MKKITIMRHAQSKFNVGECRSHDELRNCKLTEFGKLQAQSLNGSFDIVIVSPLKRALETYVNSNIKSREIITSGLFREQQKENIPLNCLELEETVLETDDDVRKRARDAIEFIKTLKCENIGIISHAHFIWYFLEQCGQHARVIGNCEVVVFDFDK